MPLCPQITNTPITVSLTADFTVTDVVPVLPATTTQVNDAVILINEKTKAYYQTTAPTVGVTEDDIWFDTDDGYKLYYYTGGAWTSVQDTSIAAAQAAATAAQTTADGKNKVYRQTSTPTGGTYVEGDLWFDTDDDNKIYRYTSGSWGTAVTLGNNALVSISANKLTAGTIDASVITVSNINAGNISTGTLAAARIAAGSLSADKITAGTITATQISSSYVYAGTIAAGNITAGTVTAAVSFNAASGTFSGTVTANSGTIGGFFISTDYIGNSSATFYINSSNGNARFNNLFMNASSGTTGITLNNGCNISMNGGDLNMATGDINSAGTVAGSTITSSGTITATGNIVANGDVNLSSTSELRVPYAYNTTTANAATVWISSTGQLRRSTASSERYKTDIVNLIDVPELDPKALYDLPVRAFRFKDGYLPETDDRFGVLVPGFIAEEMDAIYPAATDYADGVETWNDRMIIPAMLALIQDQDARIKALEGE
jgi:hypothetical protein